MSLLAPDLIYPNGELQPAMFPDGDITVATSTWLAMAEGITLDESAQAHWVYWKAYSAIAARIATLPSSETSNPGGHQVSWAADRVKTFNDLASSHLAEYSRLSGNDVMSSRVPAMLRVY